MKTTMKLLFFVSCLLLTLNNVMRTDAAGVLRRIMKALDNLDECCKKKGCPLKPPKPGFLCSPNYVYGCKCDPIDL